MIGNYRAFFDFYNSHEDVCRFLLNQYVDRVRMKCILMVSKTFGEKIPLNVLAETISEDEDLLEVLIEKEGGVIRDGQFILKESSEALSKSQYLNIKKARVSFE